MKIIDILKKFIARLETTELSRLASTPRRYGYDYAEYEYSRLIDPIFFDIFTRWRETSSISQYQLQTLSTETAEKQISSRNGYIREFCLLTLIAKNNIDSLKYVVGRLNDHVEKIRSLGMAVVVEWLPIVPIAQLIDGLPEIYALQKQSRAVAFNAVDMVNARLVQTENHVDLIAGIGHKNHKVSAICWELSNQFFAWNSFEQIRQALKSKNVITAQKVAKEVPKLSDEELRQLYAQLPKIKSMQIRREIFLHAWRRKLVEDDVAIRQALWDKSFSIRWMARLWAKDRDDFLFKEYRQEITEKSSVRSMIFALEGLLDLQDKQGIALCKAAIEHEHPSVKKAALFVLCRLDKDKTQEYLEHYVMDVEIGVVKACFGISILESCFISMRSLQCVASKRANDVEFYRHLLRYADQVSGWRGLELAALTELTSSEVAAAIKQELNSFLSSWANTQIYMAATEKQFADICSWLNQNRLNALPDGGRQLKFIFNLQRSRLAS
ncbi:hypothetical protein [Undibacterium sp.]|uniref:hypothetical protein n=1 Tax=Undibacterium sp. TaxID=1914977 RepID=UPI0025F41A76|nr:hypothetical protein [Undibacterium sp.]